MKYFLILLTTLIIGCSTTVPVTAKFPEQPKYVDTCPQLQKLKDDAKLSDVANTVNVNYSTYYECAVRNDAWIEWYKTQKIIFENIK
jgi:hypothetical protein